ncbi:MAG: oligoendopeptidase F [Candidatus Eisenbacteria sp.]|nr:oligoendopeptidase F [Candidatus Eisenbacteria bacterium]
MDANLQNTKVMESSSGSVPVREEIDRKHQWDLAVLFESDKPWEEGFEQIDQLVRPLEAMRGQLDSADAIARLFAAETELERLIERLYIYAHLREDEDTANTENQGRMGRIRAKATEVSGRLAWIKPEILSHSEGELRAWTDAPALKKDRFAMVKLLRQKPHILSDKEETLLSRAAEVFSAPQQTFGFLTDADMRFPEIKDSEGRSRELSQGRYITFLIDTARHVRRDAFNGMWETFGTFKNTLACTLSSNIKLQNYKAQVRNFPSALEASMHDDHIPLRLYETLIAATHEALPTFYQYLELRKHQLGLDDLDMYDMYVPIVPEYQIKIPFEQAREWVIEACRPLGQEYVKVLESAFKNRWIDVYENRGKRSGAYSSGCYDSLPYILLNYQGTLDDVFTLAHELGHSMHTWLAQHAQPHRFARYPIFTAEIPSTLNEALLLKHLLQTSDDPKFRAYLLNHLCDSFKGTVYRQTMFAEFEKRIHEMDAGGKPLTPDALAETYYELNGEYYGPGIDADKKIALEWARIPHFYYNFYVYKYATSFCASQILAGRLVESESKCDQYLDLLRAGGSDDPLELIRQAGVDLTDRRTLESAFEGFSDTVAELGKVLKELS